MPSRDGATAVWDFATATPKTGQPAPVVSGSVPAAGDTYGLDGPITLVFDQFLTAGTGTITLYDTTTATAVEVFDVAAGTGDNGGTVSVEDNVVTLTRGASLTDGDSYAILADAGALVGHWGTDWAGIASTAILSFTASASAPTAFTAASVSLGDTWTKSGGFMGAGGATTKLLIGFNGYATPQDPGNVNERFAVFFMEDGALDFGLEIRERSGQTRAIFGVSSLEVDGVSPLAGVPVEVLIAMDALATTAAEGLQFYVDGIKRDVPEDNWPLGIMIEPGGIIQQHILHSSVAGRNFAGSVGMLYIDCPAILPDLDNPVERSKFLPYKIGADGSGPTGSSPLFFMTGGVPNWQTGNQFGTGGGGHTTAGNFLV